MRFTTLPTRLLALASLAGLMTAPLAGCTSPGEGVARIEPASATTAPRKTGTFPSFSAPLAAAHAQMSDEEAAGLQNQLSALSIQRDSGAISEAEYLKRVAALRKLAAEHGTDLEQQLAK